MPDATTQQTAPTTAAPVTAPAQTAAPAMPATLAQPGPAVAAPASTAAPLTEGQQATQEAQPYFDKANAASQQAEKIANTPVATPATGPHARLMNMIQGLAVGLGSFGTAIATHGKEGGVQEVQEFEQNKQAMAQRAQEAAQNQKNIALQQQLTVADVNRQLGQNVYLLHTAGTSIDKSNLELQGERISNIGQAQDIRTKALQDLISTGDTNAYQGTLKQLGAATGKTETTPAAGGTAPTGVVPNGVPPIAAASWHNSVEEASLSFPNDPDIQQYKAVMNDPSATPLQMAQAARAADMRQKALGGAVASKTAQEAAEANDPVSKFETADFLQQSGSVEAIQAKLADTNTAPADVARLQRLVPIAKRAQQAKIQLDQQQKQMEQDVQAGDPNVIGTELGSGLAAPSQVLSARSMSKPFYSKVLVAADNYAKAHGAPEIMENGKPTGHYFNVAAAEAQFKYASNPQVQNTLNMIDALNEPGGDFDILKDAATSLPKMKPLILNKIFNAGATEFGSAEASRYHTALYNLATLEAQVQRGGVPDQTQIQDVLNQFNAAYAKGQLDASIQVAQRDIAARKKGIVRNNPTLSALYPDQPNANSNLPGNDVNAPAGSFKWPSGSSTTGPR